MDAHKQAHASFEKQGANHPTYKSHAAKASKASDAAHRMSPNSAKNKQYKPIKQQNRKYESETDD